MRAKLGQDCIWVTGASSGLGRALALRLAREGWSVAASARRAAALDALAAEAAGAKGRVHPLPLDVTDREAVRTAVQRIERTWGPVGVAVLNAGTYAKDTALAPDAAAFRATFDLNVMGVVNGLEAVVSLMVARGRGQIAIVASVAGYQGLPYAAAYSASKAALIALAEAQRAELERAGVLLQLVNPGFVRTPLTDRNEFPMPFLMELEDAVTAMRRGLDSERFEIVFPRRFAYLLKLGRMMPYSVFLAATRRMLKK
jgi:short-subunit dehydrogenase